MELRLARFPREKADIKFIYQKLIDDQFEYLHDAKLALPSSADQYRLTLKKLLQGGRLTVIPEDALDDGFVLGEGQTFEVQFYVDGKPSDIFGVFRLNARHAPHKRSVYLHDILIP